MTCIFTFNKLNSPLHCRKPYLEVTTLESDFVQHKKYSESIRRLKKRIFPKHMGKPGQLPPIDLDQSLDMGGGLSDKGKQYQTMDNVGNPTMENYK